MKKIYVLAALLLSVSATSCGEDWLAVESHDKIYIDEYYNSEARIYEALIAAYDPLQWFDWNGVQYAPLPVIYDIMSDNIYPGGADIQDNRQFHLMFDFSALPTNVCSSVWTVAYSGINRANCVEQYMPGVKDISEKNKALYLAEAKVLRAYYYNILWKLWGNIPYYEQNLKDPYLCPQSTADEVYAKVIVTLEDALKNGGLPMRQTDEAILGRVTYATAAMLYAEMVMYQNDQTRYQQALDYMEEIITSSKFDLADDFAGLWEQAGEWGIESIFEINYFSNGAYRSWGNPLLAGGTCLPRIIGINKLSGSSKYENGWGASPLTQNAAEMYDPADKRRAGSVYAPAEENGASYEPRYQDTGYFPAKYLPRINGTEGQIADADLNYNNNLRVYRFAETLLNAAELIVRGASGKGTAQNYLDRVRNRAGLTSVTATLDNIIAERRLEFLGEGKRYWDLVRTGKAAATLTPANDLGGYRTRSWTENKKYLPIPQDEIDAAQGTLTQNNY